MSSSCENVYLDELGQVARQTADLDFRDEVLDDAALLLDALGPGLSDEVKRHVERDFLVFDDALKIEVHDDGLGGMALHVLDDDRLRLPVHLDRQDARVERFLAHVPQQIVVVQHDRARVRPAAVDDGRHFAEAAQPTAARASLRIARFSLEFESHW